MLCLGALLAAGNLMVGNAVTAAGCCLWVASDWRTLVRWPEGSLRGPNVDATGIGLDVGALALVITGIFV